MARLAALGAVVIALAMAGGAVAFAHAARVATDPPENATLTVGPTRVSATFNEDLHTTFAAMTVVGPDGNLWSTGQPRVQGATVSVGVRPLGPAGSYTVNYRVTSADGHVVSGSWSFRLAVPGAGRPGPSAVGTDTRAPLPLWLVMAGALVAVGAAAVWAARRR